ncbi:MAG TPA: hypothetical protein VFS00_15215 [Polyangiaceae bacterium]|nr:hypothetical protein [Polyangiaceae bacterium]
MAATIAQVAAPPLAAAPLAPAWSFAEGVAAHGRIRPFLDALKAEEVGVIRANVAVAVSVVFGALPNVEAWLDAMRRLTPGLDFGAIGRLRDYTQALYYLHLMTRPAEGAPPDLPALLAEAGPLRGRLLAAAETMAMFEHFPAERVASIRHGAGHLDTADDLGSLLRLFREAGPELAAKTPVTEAMLGRAGELSFQIVAALGRRRVGTDGAGAPGRHEDDKARAFRLMVRAYDEARRGLTFLRWREGDADLLAPSIFSGRRRPRDVPAGEAPAGEAPTGEAPADEAPAGEALAGEASLAEPTDGRAGRAGRA